MRFVTSWFLIVVMVCGATGCVEEQVNYKVDMVPPGEFLLGPEDVLIVTVWKNQDLSREMVIRPDGMISMPLIGDVPAANLTANNLAKRISERLSEYMASPIVSVQLKEVNSYFIYVLGEVVRPGKYPLKSYANVMQGISLAGGFNAFAKKNKIKVLRITANGPSGSVELERVKGDLEAIESAISDFKRAHVGELPQQTEANLRTLDRLQTDLTNSTESLNKIGERLTALEKEIKEFSDLGPTGIVPIVPIDMKGGKGGTRPIDSGATRLRELKQRLKELSGTYNEKRQIEIPIRYDDILSGNAKLGNFYLRTGDVIVVP